MSVKRRFNPYSGFRWDIPHLRSIESSVSNDFDDVLRGLVTGLNRPLLVRGFNIQVPDAAVNATSLKVTVADSVLLHSSATESGTILQVPAGTADEVLDPANSRVVGAFQNGVPNYVALDYRRITDASTTDNTAGWSAAQKLEFQRTAPLGRVLDYRFVVTSSGFGSLMPLWVIGVSATGSVQYITKATQNLFRLGSGGSNPDPQASFNWGGLSNDQDGASARREWINESATQTTNPVTIAPGDDSNAFSYGDYSIHSLKDWMDAVMTRFKEVTGSSYWYLDSQLFEKSPNLFDTWFDTAGSNLTGAGSISYNFILEAKHPLNGAFQDATTDKTVLPTDSYVVGVQTGTKAIITSFSAAQLVINSVTNPSVTPFNYSETLYNRRIYRFDTAKQTLSDRIDGGYRWGYFQRLPINSGSDISVSSWSYDDRLITVNTSSDHGFQVGDQVEVTGLEFDNTPPLGEFTPSGVFMVKEVPSSTSFKFHYLYKLTTATAISASSKVRLDRAFNSSSYDYYRHPYLPRFAIEGWDYNGTTVTLLVPNHSFRAPIVQSGTIASGDNSIYGLTDTSSLRVGQEVAGPNIPDNTMIEEILDETSVLISKYATGASAAAFTFYDVAVISGLIAENNAPNGRFRITALGNESEIEITTAVAPTGDEHGIALDTSGNQNVGYMRFDRGYSAISVSHATPDPFNVIDADLDCFDDANFHYLISSSATPSIGTAFGAIQFDGIVALSEVLNPIPVSSISNPESGKLIVTTSVDHQLVTTTGPIDFTIFGSSKDSIYFRTFDNVTHLNVLSSTEFELEGTGLSGQSDYVNSGADLVFVKFSNNPYPGPIKWSDDMVVKAVIGDKSFTIPATATADGSALANRFNVNGVLGTAYLQDGEVAYITLERNKRVSSGALFSSTNGNQIVGATFPVREDGSPLVSGDFIKFEDESENRWFRISGEAGTPVLTNTFFLESDRGQPVTISQRPPRSGRLAYSKGVYDVVHVKQHWEVEPSADVYWLAVRRDNGKAASKVYFRGLELEVGEVRQINDNQATNLLTYTGAMSESAINPNYQSHDTSGQFQATQEVRVQQVDDESRMVTFYEAPDLGFQVGDKIRKVDGNLIYTYSVKQVLTSRTIVVSESLENAFNLQQVTRGADGVITVTAWGDHNLTTGDSVIISGVDIDVLNGIYEITVLNSTQFSCKKEIVFTGTTISGSATISGISASDTVQLETGMTINGPSIPADQTISNVNATSITITPGTAFVSSTETYTATFIGYLVGTGGFAKPVDPLKLGPEDTGTYLRQNYAIEDSDDLTMAIRKEDRELAKINTALTRPIYDESFLVQQINLNGTGLIQSGEYVYVGDRANPSFLAWVLHGNGTPQDPDPIEGTSPPGGWPGGHPTVGRNAILVAVISGSAGHGTTLYQKGVATGRSINNPGNPAFTAPTIKGASSFGGTDGVEIVMPPNRRTQLAGSSYIQWPSYLTYKASTNDIYAGEELMVIINDQIRQANVDYLETFGGPKGKIKIQRDLPANTRIRARLMAAYGSALAAKAAGVTLQTAYDSSFLNNYAIQELSNKPVSLTSGDQSTGGSALDIFGSIAVDGVYGGSVVGGLFGKADKSFDIGKEINRVNKLWTGESHIKTHDSHPGSDLKTITAAYTTTTAAATPILASAVTLSSGGKAVRIKAKATAWRSDGTNGAAAFEMHGAFYRDSSDVLSAIGSPASQIVGSSGDGINYAVAFGISGDDVLIVVYGSAGATVEWAVTIESQTVSNSS